MIDPSDLGLFNSFYTYPLKKKQKWQQESGFSTSYVFAHEADNHTLQRKLEKFFEK